MQMMSVDAYVYVCVYIYINIGMRIPCIFVLRRHLGAILGIFGAILGPLGAVLGHREAI